MKSPHLLSSAHDLAICTRSAQTSHKEEDFITTSQTVVSRFSAELSHRQDGPRCRPDDSCRPHARNLHHSQQYSTQSLDLNTFSWCLSSFFIGRRHAAFSSVSFCRLQSSEMGFANSPPNNTVRIAMTIPTQIQNHPLVSHMFLTFQIDTRQSFAASATAVRVVATTHELQPIGGRRGVPFKSEVIRLR